MNNSPQVANNQTPVEEQAAIEAAHRKVVARAAEARARLAAEPLDVVRTDPNPPAALGSMLGARAPNGSPRPLYLLTDDELTPEQRAARQKRSDEVARARLRYLRRAHYDLVGQFELPEHPDLLEVALADAPRETAALVAFRDLFVLNASLTHRRPLARVVSGPAGTGKTAAAAWAMLHQRPGAKLEHQVDPPRSLFVTASEIATTPRNGFSTNIESWERWIKTPVLTVDDAGLEPGDPALLVALFTERWAGPRITLVTTNFSAGDWWRRYASTRLGDRWVNEQRTRGFEWFVPVSGPSLRGAKG